MRDQREVKLPIEIKYFPTNSKFGIIFDKAAISNKRVSRTNSAWRPVKTLIKFDKDISEWFTPICFLTF